MQSTHKEAFAAYLRVQEFINSHPVPPPASYGGAKVLLDDVVSKLTGHSTGQAQAKRAAQRETARRKALQKTLRTQHLKPIHQIAKALLREAPGIQVALKMPSNDLSPMRLFADAEAIRNVAAEYEEVFSANGRPADFLTRLDAAIAAVRASLLGRAAKVGTKAGARAGLAQEVRRGRSAVEMLDAVVTTSFAGQNDVLAEWRIARRVQDVPGGGPAGNQGTADENLPPIAA